MSIAHDIYRVLLDHCTKEGDGKDTFIRAFSSLLERSTFKQGIIAHDLWKRAWDKPFFSNVRASLAARRVDQTRHVFEQLDFIRSDGWKIVGPAAGPHAAYTITGPELQDALAGRFASLNGRLEFPCTGTRLYRNRRLALAMFDIADAHRQAIDAWLSANHATCKALFSTRTVAQDRCLRNVFRQKLEDVVDAIVAVPGFARTTAYHILADVGHPVYKPDTWVRAFVLALPDVGGPLAGILGCSLNDLPATLLNPETQYARELMFDRLDTLVDDFTEPLTELGALEKLSVGFQRLRAADFLFAHIGIGAEDGFGLYRTPLDALNDPAIANKYPALAAIARNIRSLGTAPVEDATGSEVEDETTDAETASARFPNLRAAVKDLERSQPAAPRCRSCDSRPAARGVACQFGF
jgi:hypothetical protein